MKKISALLLSLCLLVLATGVASADSPRVILDQLLSGPTPALSAKDLNIPSDLTPGFHELTVEVYNDSGVVSTERALFCKDLTGELHFDNICPDLIVKKKPAPKPFDPLQRPEETLSFLALALAFVGTFFGFWRRNNEDAPPDLGSVGAGDIRSGDLYISWGDRRWYINRKVLTFADQAPKSLALQANKVSNLVARIILDARFLRAIFGSLAWLTIPASVVITYFGLQHHQNRVLPFDKYTLLAVMLIGLFDSFAGLIGALVFINFVFANGNLNSLNAILFTMGFSLLFFVPALLASKVRPLHRKVKGFSDFWERLTDYVLISLLTGWATSKLILALPSLYGFELPITKSANRIGIYIGLALVARLLLEEIAWYGFPYRLNQLHVELRKPGKFQEVRGIFVRLGILILLLQPYIGWNKYMHFGIVIFLIPQFLSLTSWRPIQSKKVGLLPKGAFRLVLLGVIGLLIQKYGFTKSLTPKEQLALSFVFLPIPGLIFALLDFISGKSPFNKKKSKWRHGYRFFGILILVILVMLILGLNPIDESIKAWQHPHDTWHSLTYKWWPQVVNKWHNLIN
ncbi:MAG: hypothetical protein RL129_856 [Actinomycetota bacterium]